MEKNKPLNRRTVITVSLVLAVAFIGLFVINVDPITADRSLSSQAELTDRSPSESAGEADPGTFNPGTIGMSIFKMLSALGVVLVCIYAGIFLLKKFLGRRYNGSGRDKFLQVLETAYVGQKKTVSLVRVAHKAVLIGVTDNNISILTELSEEETAALADNNPAGEPDGFNRILKATIDRVKNVYPKKNATVLEN
ncbi:MAG: flagellar biosynthetic protein FliO [Candidatus Zixiibacteriota bacterium]